MQGKMLLVLFLRNINKLQQRHNDSLIVEKMIITWSTAIDYV